MKEERHMNRFVIVDGLPFLLANDKTFAVRWDDEGFTVGAEVELASVPAVTHSEVAVKAKCATLDSIGVAAETAAPKAGRKKKTAKAVNADDPNS
jgi:hypothetical protein